MKIWDTFLFNGEMRMLEAHLACLKPVVNHFLIIEAKETFSGKPKKSYHQEVYELAKKLDIDKDHLTVVTVLTLRDAVDLRSREVGQREIARTMLPSLGVEDEDIVLIGDVDEILNPVWLKRTETIQAWLEFFGSATLALQFHYYSLLWVKPILSPSVVIGLYKDLKHLHFGEVRTLRVPALPIATPADFGFKEGPLGWHLSYFGSVEQIQEKIGSFFHQEYNRPEFTNAEHINECIVTGKDLFNRPEHCRPTPQELLDQMPEAFFQYFSDISEVRSCN